LYSKEQASQIRQEFWTVFGQYISPQPSADGLKVNWINYKTGVKHLSFKMLAGNRSASIAIEISHPDEGIRMLIYEQFLEFRKVFTNIIGEEWEWQPEVRYENGKMISRIGKTLENCSIYRKEDWPDLISFFRPRITRLDEFWSMAQYGFELFK